jgi:hypothetical protein
MGRSLDRIYRFADEFSITMIASAVIAMIPPDSRGGTGKRQRQRET